jgi:hypothetical protein
MRIDKNRLLDPDAILRYLHETSYGCLHQTIVADWSVYDQCLKYAGKSEEERPRPIIRLAAISWGISKRVFGRRIGVRVLSILWGLFALPSVVARCFLLHRKAYARSGTIGAPIALLQTGVANEVRIASWIAKRHSCDVELLRLDESATRSATELKAVPRAIALFKNRWIYGHRIRSNHIIKPNSARIVRRNGAYVDDSAGTQDSRHSLGTSMGNNPSDKKVTYKPVFHDELCHRKRLYASATNRRICLHRTRFP